MKKTILKFEKNDCQPCKQVNEFLDQNEVAYMSINAFDNPDMAKAYRIKSVPAIILLVDGTEIKRSIGFKHDELIEIINLFHNQN
ncbi:thioredoxin family protein [Sphingobacterium siyangense]|uniref:thioredoxin family protein n=1 Tax=Sphingobacterium siyangense TaxID=459529 RepID=UPI00289CA4DF|nr:thioredoxin family protein [Sphingobacterium siyangense]